MLLPYTVIKQTKVKPEFTLFSESSHGDADASTTSKEHWDPSDEHKAVFKFLLSQVIEEYDEKQGRDASMEYMPILPFVLACLHFKIPVQIEFPETEVAWYFPDKPNYPTTESLIELLEKEDRDAYILYMEGLGQYIDPSDITVPDVTGFGHRADTGYTLTYKDSTQALDFKPPQGFIAKYNEFCALYSALEERLTEGYRNL